MAISCDDIGRHLTSLGDVVNHALEFLTRGSSSAKPSRAGCLAVEQFMSALLPSDLCDRVCRILVRWLTPGVRQ